MSLPRELVVFLAAVFVGSLAGMSTGMVLTGGVAEGVRAGLALAVGTTLTGAVHARLAHGDRLWVLVPRVLFAMPLAYGVMAGVHRLLAR